MHHAESDPDRRGIPEPLRPEEIEPVGRLLAEHYEAARHEYAETGKTIARTAMLGYSFALHDDLQEHGQSVETATRVYKIGPEGRVVSEPLADRAAAIHQEQDRHRA
jgi:hypothetical protein